MDYSSTNSSHEEELTCIQDTATSPARSSVVSTIPNQNTERTRKTSFKILPLIKHLNPFVFIFFEAFTWTCLQSWPLAGSCIRRKVIGHLSETLMAVCSTPSSPLSVALPDDAATLLKFLLTLTQKKIDECLDQEELIRMWHCRKNCIHTFGDAVLCREKPLLQ